MVPRRAEFGEAVDDHQLPFTQKLAEGGLATAVYEMSELPSAIAAARGKAASSHVMGSASELTRWLEAFWRGLEARASS
jgi:UDP-N-acetylglucosamine transferase subunit ALG13